MTDIATATGYTNQRKLVDCQNGNRVMLVGFSTPHANAYYSADAGVTWNYIGTMDIMGWSNGSVFMDQDDYLHVVWKQSGSGGGRTDGSTYYARGTPNAGRTSWTWSGSFPISTDANANYPDVVAHREGTGWKAHVVVSYASSAPNNDVQYRRLNIDSGQTISYDTALFGITATYGLFAHTNPSIDFNHTGDGKTVASGTPHLYCGWNAGAIAAGKGIRFKKGTYAAGAWTWGTERELDATRLPSNNTQFWVNCVFDGTRAIVAGTVYDGANLDLVAYERDAADTTTTTRVLIENMTSAANAYAPISGSTSYDADGNLYFIGRGYGQSAQMGLTIWTRSSGVLTSVPLGPNGYLGNVLATLKRGTSGGVVEWIFTTGNNNPWSVKYDRYTLTDYPSPAVAQSNAAALSASNQRKIDRCQNNVLWMFMSIPNLAGFYSLDNGVTWTFGGYMTNGANIAVDNASIFIDLDDYLHVVFRHQSGGSGLTAGYIYYMRGTPNAGRTAWTWSAVQQIHGLTDGNYPDVVAHREGTGWRAHVVNSQLTGAPANYCTYSPITITSGGAISLGTRLDIGGSYAANLHTFPSIDFNHTGDGKTVAGGTPHVYAAWSAGKTGAGFGIRFKKATYAGGVWTWGTEREINNGQYVVNDSSWVNCMFDGTRAVIAGRTYTGADSWNIHFERDAADTATTMQAGTWLDNANFLQYGSCGYDSAGNIYWIGKQNATGQLVIYKWNRSTTQITTIKKESLAPGVPGPYVSVKRGYSNALLEWGYVTGNASPYIVKYDQLALAIQQNLAPDAVLASTNVGGTYADVDDSPDAPDANAQAGTGSWSVRYSFPSPSGQLSPGAGLQKFRIKLT